MKNFKNKHLTLQNFRTITTSSVRSSSLLPLHPWYVTGFSDGESCFSTTIRKNNKLKAGWEVLVAFSIALHKKDLVLLESIKSFLGVGNITNGGKDMIQFRVNVLKDLTAVINPFDKYPLITQKFADYQLFKQVVDLKNCKEHFTSEGLQKIVNLKASINWGLSSELKAAFPEGTTLFQFRDP